jgi:hypothetical protein
MASEPLQLVTDAEYQQELRQTPPRRTRATPSATPAPNAPLIEVQAPKLQDTLKPPFPIRLVFKPADGAQIDPSSFKVYYGWLRIDITERIVQHAKLSRDGLSVENASIPAGSHRLLLEIRDNKERKSEMTLSFKVE